MFRNAFTSLCFVIVLIGAGCGSNVPSNVDVKLNTNSNSNTATEIKLDFANMPAGLSGKPITMSNNLPPGISLNANLPPSANKTPGIPSAEELKKGFKPKGPIPGIPDQETIRRQMNSPMSNINALPANSAPMMKSKRPLGGKPQ